MKKTLTLLMALALVLTMIVPMGATAENKLPYAGENHITFSDGENFATEENQLLVWFQPSVVESMKIEGATLDVLNLVADELGVDLLVANQTESKNDFFTLKLQEGKAPEVIEAFGNVANYVQQVNDGMLEPIPVDKVKELMPNYVKWLESCTGPDVWNILAVDGQIYALPNVWSLGAYGMGMGVREEMFEAAGAKVPTTIDEWTAAMALLKDKGNIPFVASKDIGVPQATSWVYGAYGATPTAFYPKDGKIVYGSIEPECKEALKVLADWYAKGYIDNEYATIDDATCNQKFADGKAASTLFYFWAFFPKNAHLGDDYNKASMIAAGAKVNHIALPTGPNGASGALQNPSIGAGNRFAAGTSLEKMEQYMKFWEACAFDQEYIKRFMAGFEGETYTMVDGLPVFAEGLADVLAEDGTIAVDNKPARQKLGFDLGFNCIPVSFNNYDLQYWNLDPAYAQARADAPAKNPGVYDVMRTYQRPVYEAKREVLEKMADDFHYDVITGKKSVDDFDAFVTEWLAAGGQEALDEANALFYASK